MKRKIERLYADAQGPLLHLRPEVEHLETVLCLRADATITGLDERHGGGWR